MSNYLRKSLVVVLAVVVLSACSNSNVSPSAVSDGGAGTTTTMAPIPTTIPWVKGAPEAAWASWLTTFAVVDASEISESECGVFAILVTDESLTFYSWDGVQWSDKSDVLGGGRGKYPQKVYSSDYTNDGVIDYFVTYRIRKNSGPTYGGFFTIPWSGDMRCVWSWVDIDNGRDISKVIDSPEIEQRKGRVYAAGYVNRRYSSRRQLKYSPSANSFVFDDVFQK
ncbi:MAG: hypothetical protein CK521_06300 [Acidimicrobium sp.]|nr:MAG: hypothetical protein CK521_06300 [Acidimicrobium sp.]